MSDLSVPYGVDAAGRTATAANISEHIRHLMLEVLFTIPGERVMRPDFGTPIYELVFEGASGALADAVRALVHAGLQRWLGDRILVQSVEAEAIDARLEITVTYRLVGSDEGTTTVTVSSAP
jgi:phage baseplate assembly protein W